jgi:transcriptional regulator with XRE-family HTH domain
VATLGEQLKALRLETGQSLRDKADDAKISHSTVRRIEEGDCGHLPVIEALAASYGMRVTLQPSEDP